jgi:hypothetical protein
VSFAAKLIPKMAAKLLTEPIRTAIASDHEAHLG